jgi:hypothetical protein
MKLWVNIVDEFTHVLPKLPLPRSGDRREDCVGAFLVALLRAGCGAVYRTDGSPASG